MIVAPPPHAPIAPPPRPPLPVAVGRRRPTPPDGKVNCTAAWTLIGVLCAFKIGTIGLILALAQASQDRLLVPLLIAANWPWLIPLALVISTIPFGLWFRLVRARSKRRQLQYAEWNVGG